MALFGLIIIIRFFGIQFVRDFKKMNYIITTVQFDDDITIDTMASSLFFDVFNRRSIIISTSSNHFGMAPMARGKPFNNWTLRSDNNFAISMNGKEFYLIRSLFDGEEIFNEMIGRVATQIGS